ncbi:MAG: SUMF1/EgtB/PvdO family nonheme iron enzyme [Planctomycetota bacterium]
MRRSWMVIVAICLVVGVIQVGTGRAAKMPKGDTYTNSVGMKFVRIKPGSFRMGVGETPLPHELTNHRGTQFKGDLDERPNHKVKITKPFYAGIYEVTNFQYELFDPEHRKLRGKDNGLSEDDDEAVINVNWYEARAFCKWLSDLEGLHYRLPTEAEWEYACRAGTKTHYYTGDVLPKEFRKNARMEGTAVDVPLHVGKTMPNKWGLYDMHGNVEEWCYDWYGPYKEKRQKNPVGYAEGDFKVLRGGSHGTHIYYLRSANRMGTVPEDKHWLIGFRVVIGKMPKTKPLALPKPPLNQRDVVPRKPAVVAKGPDPEKPYFKGPRKFMTIPKEANGPIFAGHNHCPAIVECPNGDLLAIWYTGIGERERNMAVAASRLRWGSKEWEPASPFWDPPDRNDTALSLWFDGKKTIYHFNSLSISSNWARMAVVMRTSTDSGATWSRPRLILPDHNRSVQISEPVIRLNDGGIAITHDGGRTLWVSRDEGLTWTNPAGTVSGNHPSVVQLSDGRLFGLGRGGDIDGRMPVSLSTDGGETFIYSASEFPGIDGGQRLVLLRLRDKKDVVFLASFGSFGTIPDVPVMITDSQGNKHQAKELFGALSLDGGKTWPYKRVISPGGRPITTECTDGGAVTLSGLSSEHRGYMSVCQGLDGVIHLISSRQHYAFNLKWLMTPPPPPGPPLRVKHEVETFSGPKDFDLDGWFDYKSYTGGFNRKGQYAIDSIMAYGGINKVVGTGSFEATFVFDNISWHPGLRGLDISFGFKDKLSRTWFLGMNQRQMVVYFKDNTARPGTRYPRLGPVKYSEVPKSLKARFVWNEKTRRCQVFYGFNGDGPTTEMPRSKAGLYLGEPFSESNAAYVLMTDGSLDVDHFEIKPLGP